MQREVIEISNIDSITTIRISRSDCAESKFIENGNRVMNNKKRRLNQSGARVNFSYEMK